MNKRMSVAQVHWWDRFFLFGAILFPTAEVAADAEVQMHREFWEFHMVPPDGAKPDSGEWFGIPADAAIQRLAQIASGLPSLALPPMPDIRESAIAKWMASRAAPPAQVA